MAENCAQNNLPCCGCGACITACPQGALALRVNQDGFYCAVADSAKCNNCSLCLNVCPKFDSNYCAAPKQFTSVPLFAAWSNNAESRAKSASGAIAYEIALYGLANGYKIAGAAFDGNTGRIKTVVADTKDKLEELRGSKYLQSDTTAVFKEIAESKDKFIFFGTPCQVMGLKLLARAGNFEDRILTVDFFCHGVPSIKIFDAAIKQLAPNGAEQVYFRHKQKGRGPYTMLIKNAAGDIIVEENKNPFYALYFSDLFLDDACYTCRAKKGFDFADIRLGDYWGESFGNDGLGVSAVCANTLQAELILNELKQKNLITLSPRTHDICLREQACFKDTPCNAQVRRSLFAVLNSGACADIVIERYIKTLPLKKYIVFKLKRLLPFPLFAALKKIYRGFEYGK